MQNINNYFLSVKYYIKTVNNNITNPNPILTLNQNLLNRSFVMEPRMKDVVTCYKIPPE